ncbi:hypothetical protein KCU85_g172, partial [Aureobasidium melanogenum]
MGCKVRAISPCKLYSKSIDLHPDRQTRPNSGVARCLVLCASGKCLELVVINTNKIELVSNWDLIARSANIDASPCFAPSSKSVVA